MTIHCNLKLNWRKDNSCEKTSQNSLEWNFKGEEYHFVGQLLIISTVRDFVRMVKAPEWIIFP